MKEFNFGNANKMQREAIKSTEGPVLIIAGPGTGKTFTLVKRVAYLVIEKRVEPSKIMIVTFTKKAAKEIVTRVSNELLDFDVSIDINEMYVGTFHSICLRILEENLEFSKIQKNYKMIDQFQQSYIIYKNIKKFKEIENFREVIPIKESWESSKDQDWDDSKTVAGYINKVREECIDYKELLKSFDDGMVVLGKLVEIYLDIAKKENILDFSDMQSMVLEMLESKNEVCKSLREKIDYIMVDEFQDTNYVQEQLVLKFAKGKNNICVVGDDDQGIYRFRGATIRNILEFPKKFKSCKRIKLEVNYRSNKGIINFYNEWMNGEALKHFKWGDCRFDKKIVCGKINGIDETSVIKIIDKYKDDNEWYREILRFIKDLKISRKITNYNQIAFLFRSVKNKKVTGLANYLELNGINIYSPRANMFFKRDEIMAIIGILIRLFPKYEAVDSFLDSINIADKIISEDKKLFKWVKDKRKIHKMIDENLNYGLLGLVYEIFQFEYFKKYLDVDMKEGNRERRPAHNLSIFIDIVKKFEDINNLRIIKKENIEWGIGRFFNKYLNFLSHDGVDEYVDEAEYAPSGCVSFLTIHQSKGMEFPVVFVDSLISTPRCRNCEIDETLEVTNSYK